MSKKGPDTPPPRDYYKETSDALQAQVNMAPQLYNAEATYRPMYQRLELAGYRNTLLGRVTEEDLSPTSRAEYQAAVKDAEAKGLAKPDPASYSDRGLIDILERDIMPSMARADALAQTAQRTADIADVERLGQRASEAYLNADPRSKSLIEALNAEALRSLQANGTLTADQQRYATQVARQGMADRGLAYGNQGIAADVLGTYNLSEARRTAALQNAGAVLGLNKQFTADPFQAILGRQGQAFNAGIGQQQFASGMATSIGPRLFSPESQYMSDLQGSNQQTAAAYASARAQVTSGMWQGLGSAIGGGLSGWGSAIGKSGGTGTP